MKRDLIDYGRKTFDFLWLAYDEQYPTLNNIGEHEAVLKDLASTICATKQSLIGLDIVGAYMKRAREVYPNREFVQKIAGRWYTLTRI